MRSEAGNSARKTALVSVLALLAAPSAFAQSYPSKPIRIIMPFSTGGTDLVTRWLALKLSPVLGQQVVPEPRTGAGGNIAHEMAAKAAPDGYTLLMAAPPFVVNPTLHAKVAYDPFRDFAPISLNASIPTLLVSHPSVPAKNLAELIQIARSHPGKLAYASGGIGSTPHLAGELLKSLTRTNLVHVPYKGGALGPGRCDERRGRHRVHHHVERRRVVRQRRQDARHRGARHTNGWSSIPQVPTAPEAGLAQLISVNWYVLVAPAGTPREIIERLNAETAKIMQTPDTRERLLAVGGEPATSTPEQAAEFLRAESARWGKVVRDAGIRAE